MPRKYFKGNGRRTYASYTQNVLAMAVRDVTVNGMSQKIASAVYGVPRGTIQNRIRTMHVSKVGRPPVLSDIEEKLLIDTITAVTDWGYPMSPADVKDLVAKYLERSGRIEPRFKNNTPGDDFIQSFVKRNGLTRRTAGNIKRARAAVCKEDIVHFFENAADILKSVPAKNIYNYDETNITDDPGSKKVCFL
jgi:hypothetical protein